MNLIPHSLIWALFLHLRGGFQLIKNGDPDRYSFPQFGIEFRSHSLFFNETF